MFISLFLKKICFKSLIIDEDETLKFINHNSNLYYNLCNCTCVVYFDKDN